MATKKHAPAKPKSNQPPAPASAKAAKPGYGAGLQAKLALRQAQVKSKK